MGYMEEQIQIQETLDNERSELALKYNDEIASRIVNEKSDNETVIYNYSIVNVTQDKMILKTSSFQKALPMIIIVILFCVLLIPLWLIYQEYTYSYFVITGLFAGFLISFFLSVKYLVGIIFFTMIALVSDYIIGYKSAVFSMFILLMISVLITNLRNSLYKVIFDLSKGCYSILGESGDINDIHAVVLETKWLSRSNRNGRTSKSVRVYYHSIVFENKENIHLKTGKVYSEIYGEGLRVSKFLNVPYWNFVLEREK